MQRLESFCLITKINYFISTDLITKQANNNKIISNALSFEMSCNITLEWDHQMLYMKQTVQKKVGRSYRIITLAEKEDNNYNLFI